MRGLVYCFTVTSNITMSWNALQVKISPALDWASPCFLEENLLNLADFENPKCKLGSYENRFESYRSEFDHDNLFYLSIFLCHLFNGNVIPFGVNLSFNFCE